MAGSKVFVLLDVVEGEPEEVAQMLRGKPGVIMTEVLEGPPDLIIIMEALKRQQLAQLTLQVLASVETMTENISLLPVKDQLGSSIS